MILSTTRDFRVRLAASFSKLAPTISSAMSYAFEFLFESRSLQNQSTCTTNFFSPSENGMLILQKINAFIHMNTRLHFYPRYLSGVTMKDFRRAEPPPLHRASFRLDKCITTHLPRGGKERYASINKRRMLQSYTCFLLLSQLSHTLAQ